MNFFSSTFRILAEQLKNMTSQSRFKINNMVWRLLASKCPNGRTLKSAAISGSLVVLAKTKIWRSWGSYFRLLLRRGTARGIEIVKRLQGLLLLEEFQPVSKQISGQHQYVYYCTPSFAFLIETTFWGILLFLYKFWPSPLKQGWAGMTFESSGTGTGMDNPIPKVREREGNGKNPFPKFGNGKGMKNKTK